MSVPRSSATEEKRAVSTAFDTENLAPVASPVTATMNDLPAPVSNAVGWPGTSDTYRVDMTVPGVSPGTASVALTVGWMQGPELKILVR